MRKPFHFLIIDDDEDDKDFFCDAVTELDSGIACSSASNGVDALAMLPEFEVLPDYIFLDLNMPKMNGKQLLIHLKKHEEFRFIPVVIFSTSKSEDEMEETKRLGAIAFIVKPSSIRELVDELRTLIMA